jgi:hypothetical protein
MKWISPLVVVLLASVASLPARAGLINGAPGACQPAKVVEPIPGACKPVHAYLPPSKACEPVKSCEPVRPRISFERVGHRIDRVVHASFHKIHVWHNGCYATDQAGVKVAPTTPAQLPAPAPPVPGKP